jgi:ferredoxin, 2Fe-2S
MPNITYILPDGSRQTLDLPHGYSVMEGAIRSGLPGILGECGGSASCATCHIYIEGGPTDEVPLCQDTEDDMLDYTAADRLPSSRLACQVKITAALDGLVVRIADRM